MKVGSDRLLPFTANYFGDGLPTRRFLEIFDSQGSLVGRASETSYGYMYGELTDTQENSDWRSGLIVYAGLTETLTFRGTITDDAEPEVFSMTINAPFTVKDRGNGALGTLTVVGDFPLGNDDPGSNWIRIVSPPDAGALQVDAGQVTDAGTDIDAHYSVDAGQVEQCIGQLFLDSYYVYLGGYTSSDPLWSDLALGAIHVANGSIMSDSCEGLRVDNLYYNLLGTIAPDQVTAYELQDQQGNLLVRGTKTPLGVRFPFPIFVPESSRFDFAVRAHFDDSTEASRLARVGKTMALELQPTEAIGTQSAESLPQHNDTSRMQWLKFVCSRDGQTFTDPNLCNAQAASPDAGVITTRPDAGPSGTVLIEELPQDDVANHDRIVHVGEFDIPLFEHSVREPTNNEMMSVSVICYGIVNAWNTLQSYKLWNATTNQQHGITRDAVTYDGRNGEVCFNNIRIPVVEGSEIRLRVYGTPVASANLTSGNYDVKMGVTYVEFTGDRTGETTRVSGGLVIGQGLSDLAEAGTFDSMGSFIVVNDVRNFKVGDEVYFDVNNDGDFRDQVNGVHDFTPHRISYVGMRTIQLEDAGHVVLGLGEAVKSGARLTAFPFSSYNTEVQEIKPTIHVLWVGSGSPVMENQVATYVVQNHGGRSMQLLDHVLQVNGSYPAAVGRNPSFGPKKFKLDRADQSTGSRMPNWMGSIGTIPMRVIAGSGCVTPTGVADPVCAEVDTIVLSGTSLGFRSADYLVDEVAPDTRGGYAVVANTTSMKDPNSATIVSLKLRMLGRKASPTSDASDGIQWSYIRSASGADSGALSICESYPVEMIETYY